MMRKCAVFICLVTFISCGNKNKMPAGVLKPVKMQAVLWDVIKAEAFAAEMVKKDTSKNAAEENLKLKESIFIIHKVTKDEFEKSYSYYKANPGELKVIMDSMVNQAERNRTKLYKIKKPIEGN